MPLVRKIVNLSTRIKQKYGYILLSLSIFNPLIFGLNLPSAERFKNKEVNLKAELNQPIGQAIYPVIKKRPPRQIKKVRLTAYSSTPDQTSGDPFITASGKRVHDGVIAANCLPFGTRVRIPELYGGKVFIVEDRLAPRIGCNVIDIWFPDRGSALAFGSKYSTIEVL